MGLERKKIRKVRTIGLCSTQLCEKRKEHYISLGRNYKKRMIERMSSINKSNGRSSAK